MESKIEERLGKYRAELAALRAEREALTEKLLSADRQERRMAQVRASSNEDHSAQVKARIEELEWLMGDAPSDDDMRKLGAATVIADLVKQGGDTLSYTVSIGDEPAQRTFRITVYELTEKLAQPTAEQD